MNLILATIRSVARRITLNHAFRFLAISFALLFALFSFFVLLDKLVFLGIDLVNPLLFSGLVLVGIAALRVLFLPVKEPGAAQGIDTALGLKERVSTALAVSNAEDPASQAVVLDAADCLGQVKAIDQFPYRSPTELKFTGLTLAALVLFSLFVPNFDLLSRKEVALKKQKEKIRLEEQAEKLKMQAKRLKEKIAATETAKTRKLVKELEKAAQDLKKAKDKREGFLKLAEIGDKLKERREELAKLTQSKKRFQPDSLSKYTKELQEALSKGDYKAAKRHLERMKEFLRDKLAKKGPDAREALTKIGRELDRLGKQLEEMGGMDELARAFKSAAGLMSDLKPEEMENLQKMLKKLDEAKNQLAQQERLMQEMEMVNMALEELEAAKEGLAGMTGKGMAYVPNAMTEAGGAGRGGRGKGSRDRGSVNNPNFKKTKDKVKLGKGEILGTFLVKGLPPKGETKVKYREVVTHYREAAEEALEKERIPANYRELVRDYFESLEPEGK